MRRIVVILAVAVSLSVLALANVQAAPDAPVSDTVEPWVEMSREIARPFAGIVAFAPIRLTDAGCTVDGELMMLTFESSIGAARVYASIGFPSAQELAGPDATTVIVGSSQPSSASIEAAWCDRIPSALPPAAEVTSARDVFATQESQPTIGTEEASSTLPPQSHWDRLATGNLPGALSLGGAAAISDLIVVGRWVGPERGESYWTPENETVGWFAVAVIKVDTLIQGTLPDTAVHTIRVPFLLSFGRVGSVYPEKDYETIDRARPEDPAVLFLQSWSSYFRRGGVDVPDWVKGLVRPDIYRTIGSDGALPLEGGSVSDVTFEFDMPQWRLDLAGKNLDTLITKVVAAEQPAAP